MFPATNLVSTDVFRGSQEGVLDRCGSVSILFFLAVSLTCCSETVKKPDARLPTQEMKLVSDEMPQGTILVGTSWRHCSFVYSTNQPSGEVRIFELTKITFTSAKDIIMVGETYTSDDQCKNRLIHDEVKKIAGDDYDVDFFKLSNQSFTYAVGSEANPNATYDFDVTDHADYRLFTEIRLTENKFQLAYACQTEDNIKAGDCTAIDGDRPSRRARNFKNEDLVITWTKWD